MSKIKEVSQSLKGKIKKVNFKKLLITTFIFTFLMATVVLAEGDNPLTNTETDQKWTDVMDFAATWVTRLAGAVAFLGAVEWIWGRQSNQPEKQTDGLKFFTSGLMLAAVAGALDFFLF